MTHFLDARDVEPWLFLIPLLPFVGAAILGLLGRFMSRQSVALIACGAIFGAFAVALLALLPMALPVLSEGRPPRLLSQELGTWFASGALTIKASLVMDRLSAVLVAMITGVSLLIHIYSTEYMREDRSFARFFAYLNLFVGFMLTLVLANNLVLLFVGWEGVGLCSYLLIGFWFEDDAKASAGRKAFIVNRIGDVGMLIGLFTLFALFGSLDMLSVGDGAALQTLATAGYSLDALVPGGPLASLGLTYGQALTVATLALFVGATGKSAQLPLFVWLPDAMAGPTPVSALIHAATMVTAGVYLIARLSFLFALAPATMAVVTLVGAATALFAALVGFAQNDIKKVLAWSTISQLGFMMIGVGIGAYWQGTFHLLTHAFFKACLFLGAGAVIMGCHHEQDIRKMGGLWRRMPSTAITFLIGCMAITGLAPLSGFFSKDAILHYAHGAHLQGFEWVGPTAYWLGSLAALGTAFYMFRLFFLVFAGKARSDHAAHAHECGPAVTFPLWTLAILSVVALFWGLPWRPFALTAPTGELEALFQNFTRGAFALARRTLDVGQHGEAHGGLLAAMGVALLLAWVGGAAAALLYWKGLIAKLAPLFERAPMKQLRALAENRFYVDELYAFLIVRPFKALAFMLWRIVDTFVIDRLLIQGSARLTGWAGAALRYLQNGDVQRYAAAMVLGAVLLLWVLT